MPSPSIARGSLTAKVAAAIQDRIAGRQLVAGARVPSVRALARTMNVSKSTVVEAYERLAADETGSGELGRVLLGAVGRN